MTRVALRPTLFVGRTYPSAPKLAREMIIEKPPTEKPPGRWSSALKENLLPYTDPEFAAQPLTEKSEMLLGLRPWLKRS